MLKKLLALLAALALAAGGFYYFYWMKTPAYAAGEIYDAVRAKNYQLFRERVDLEKVYSAAIDDLITDTGSSDKRDKKLASGLLKMLKKPLTAEMIRQTEIAFTKDGKDESDSPLAAAARTAKVYVGSAALSLTNIFDVEETNGTVLAHVKLRDKDLGRDFTWDVQMEKDVNGLWTATRIVNLKEYLAERRDAILEKETK